MTEMARDDAAKIVRDFVAERLDGELDALQDFDISTLADDAKYGRQGQNDFDADDCLLTRAVCVLAWSDVFPGLDMLSIGSKRAYRGDTMNTFHTMFGRDMEEWPGHYRGIEKFHPDDEMRNLAGSFLHVVTTIGNYVVLPNRPNRNRETLNTYRGCHPEWHDYFDEFMAALEKVLADAPGQDGVLRDLVRERNGDAFGAYFGAAGFRKLAERLFLGDYLGEDGHALILYSRETGKVMHHWMEPRPPDEEYMRGARWYVRNAVRIIRSRAERIVNALRSKI